MTTNTLSHRTRQFFDQPCSNYFAVRELDIALGTNAFRAQTTNHSPRGALPQISDKCVPRTVLNLDPI